MIGFFGDFSDECSKEKANAVASGDFGRHQGQFERIENPAGWSVDGLVDFFGQPRFKFASFVAGNDLQSFDAIFDALLVQFEKRRFFRGTKANHHRSIGYERHIQIVTNRSHHAIAKQIELRLQASRNGIESAVDNPAVGFAREFADVGSFFHQSDF